MVRSDMTHLAWAFIKAVRPKEPHQLERYGMSVLSVSTPAGQRKRWTRRLIAGTLQSARPNRQTALARAWRVDVSLEQQFSTREATT